MPKGTLIVQEGTVVQALPDTIFKVELDCNGVVILCHVCGKMRMNRINVLEGDRVRVEMSPYDLARGRIVSRL